MPWTDWWPMHWFGMTFGPVVMLAVILLVALVILRAFRGSAETPKRTARDVLDERYARGEIEKPEYESKRRELAA